MARKSKGKKAGDSVTLEAQPTLELTGDKATGKTNLGLTCIGEICFSEDGFEVNVPEDADPECAKRVADAILKGGKITYTVSPKAVSKTKEEFVADSEH
jgi:hypothetical protein